MASGWQGSKAYRNSQSVLVALSLTRDEQKSAASQVLVAREWGNGDTRHLSALTRCLKKLESQKLKLTEVEATAMLEEVKGSVRGKLALAMVGSGLGKLGGGGKT